MERRWNLRETNDFVKTRFYTYDNYQRRTPVCQRDSANEANKDC
jgi:hypothetical protein